MSDELCYDGDEIGIRDCQPYYTMVFSNNDGEVAKLDWNDGTLKFDGDIDESAKIFFDFLKPYIDAYIATELKKI